MKFEINEVVAKIVRTNGEDKIVLGRVCNNKGGRYKYYYQGELKKYEVTGYDQEIKKEIKIDADGGYVGKDTIEVTLYGGKIKVAKLKLAPSNASVAPDKLIDKIIKMQIDPKLTKEITETLYDVIWINEKEGYELDENVKESKLIKIQKQINAISFWKLRDDSKLKDADDEDSAAGDAKETIVEKYDRAEKLVNKMVEEHMTEVSELEKQVYKDNISALLTILFRDLSEAEKAYKNQGEGFLAKLIEIVESE